MHVTLADLRRHSIARIRGVFEKTSADLPNVLLDSFITEAYVQIQRACRVWTKKYEATTTDGQLWVPVPTDLLGQLIVENSMLIKSGTATYQRPTWREPQTLIEMYGELDDVTGDGVADWGFGMENFDTTNASYRQFVLMPPPVTGYATGLRCHYFPHPGILNAVYDQNTVTATFTISDATVTFSSAIASQLVVDRMIGLKADTDDSTLPTKWYRIKSVTDSTHVELDRVYEETTASGAYFTISQISYLDLYVPGVILYAPTDFVLWKIAEMDAGFNGALPFLEQWNRTLGEVKKRVIGDANTEIYQPLSESRWPAHRRGF